MADPMSTKPSSPIHSAGPRSGNKPRIYNRPWHFDADDRRHHGRRTWDPNAIDAFLNLASQIDQLYPPDFSARNAIRLRASNHTRPIAELRTSNPTRLVLVLQPCKAFTLPALRKSLQLPVKLTPTRRQIHLEITSPAQVASRSFARFFTKYTANL
ncbi:MAG: hypothetical protein ACM359_04030 [Bacillota bacterium]